ncbi:hypothetical protein C1H76_4257 [Elsinoe australis]|uniref:Uncharacterized protein n=1 Tax=Elsinoe australis TaxID=40998 RepID=A0A2P8AIR0_9PEZI|nr:hypothetical protein B9Z65_513 [Elsinoe australis]TKX23191.1 hypothetical protein C1H76_4257 [Elsinoe australis]
MATVRDPAFWKRFSTAVHLNDVESVAGSNASSPNLSKRPTLDHQDSWLAREEKKKKKRTLICWLFWIGILAFSGIVVVVVIWLIKSGTMQKLTDKINGEDD